MEKNNKIEIIGLGLMTIGGLFWLSEKFYVIEQLNSIYSWARIVLFLGLSIWALGLMKKQADQKKQNESNKED